MKQVVVTGSVAFDHIMSMPGRFKDHIMPDKLHILNISFYVETLRRGFGGTGGNQAYNLTLLGYKPLLVAAAGRDFGEYKQFLQKAGVGIEGVREYKELTATGFAVADQDDNQIWSFYAGAMKRATKLSLKPYLDKANLVMVAPNEPEAMTRYVGECSQAGVDFLYDPAFWIPNLGKQALVKGVKGARIVIGNDYEIELLLRRTGLKKKQVLTGERILITTLGAKGSIIETGKETFEIPAAKPKNTSDPTGAGDAYRAGFIAGYLKNLPLSVCGRMGSVTAVYTVEKYGTQTHRFTLAQFKKRYQENFGESLTL